MLRISEAAVWRTVKRNMPCECCWRVEGKSIAPEDNNTLASFLATSFNVELVFTILKGIYKFSAEMRNVKLGIKNTKESKITYRVAKSVLKLDHIKIEDPKMWDVLKVEDFVDADRD